MASYGYGPPPPPPAQPSAAGYPQYPQAYHQLSPHTGHAPRGGRGANQSSGRGEYHGPHYGYNPQHSQHYGQQAPTEFTTGHAPQGNYPPQQWHDASHSLPQQQPPHASLPPNYHPSYAPQIYHPQPYGQQPVYSPPTQHQQQTQQQPVPLPQQPQQQAYGHHYGPPSHHNGLSVPNWGAPSHPSQNSHNYGNSRGHGSHQGDRRSSKAQMMGPPIRLGFDNANSPDQTAPVSNGFSGPSYGAPQGSPAPYAPGSFQGYPPASGPHPAGPPQYDPYLGQGSRPHTRGGFHNYSVRGRPQLGGDKMRHKKSGLHTSALGVYHQKPDAASAGKKKKRKTNTLGLTPGEETDDDDADEEAKLLELIGPDAPNPTDLAAWIAERKRNFPVQARIRAKLSESSNFDRSKLESVKDAALEKQQQRAEKLRRQLEKVESSIKRKREQQDEGDEMRDVEVSPSVSSDSKSDDEGPEALPSRSETASFLPPPPSKADPSKHCKYYSTGGTCGKKGKCRFVHDLAVREAALKEREMNGGRMTLQQRLILNDKDQEDLTIVKTLQYLKEKGVMKDCSAGIPISGQLAVSSTPDAEPSPQSGSTNPSHLPPPPIKTKPHHSLPPQPPTSLLPNAQTVRYQGWNLSGYGNTGIKSDDL